jgi:hypothetical protein
MAYEEKPCPDLGLRLTWPVGRMRTGVNPVASYLRYYCHNTDNKDAL